MADVMNRFWVAVALAGSVLGSAGASAGQSLICAYSGEPQPVHESIPEQDDSRTRQALNAASERIHGLLELRQNFEIDLAGLPGAVAQVETKGGKRIVYFDRSHFRRLLEDEPTRRTAETILAHEIGHLLQGHTLDAELLVTQELEADAFSGRVMYMLGASLMEAQRAARLYAKGVQAGHPPQEERLLAVRRGWRGARERDDLPQRQRDYAAAMASVARAIAENDSPRANRLLERFLPRPGTRDVRGFAWFHLWRQTHPEDRLLVLPPDKSAPWRVQHLEAISSISYLAVSAWNGKAESTLFLYDLGISPPRVVSQWQCLTGSFGVVPDGTSIAYAERRASDASGLVLRRIRDGATIRLTGEHRGDIRSVAMSPDGGHAATVDEGGVLVLWDLQTKRAAAERATTERLVTSLAFSSDGRVLLMGGIDGRLGQFSVPALTPQPAIDPGVGPITAIAVGPAGARVAIGGERGTVLLASGDSASAEPMSPDRPRALRFSPDGRILVAGSGPAVAQLFETRTGQRIGDIRGHVGTVDAFAFSTDGTYLFTGDFGSLSVLDGPLAIDGAVRAVRWNTSATVMEIPIAINVVLAAASSDGALFAAPAPENPSVLRIWNPDGTSSDYQASGPLSAIAISDDRTLAAGGTRASYGPSNPECACATDVWSLQTGQRLFSLDGHESNITSIAFAGNLIATASCDRIRIWRRDGQLQDEIEEPNLCAEWSEPMSVAFTPDLARLAWVSRGVPSVRLWKVKDRIPDTTTFNLTEQRGASVLAISPDGSWLATGNEDWDITLWSLQRQRAPITLSGHRSAPQALAFSPDSLQLVSAAGAREPALLWETSMGLRVGELPAAGARLHRLTFAPDGTLRGAAAGPHAAQIIWKGSPQEWVLDDLRERFRLIGGRAERDSLIAALWASSLMEKFSAGARLKFLEQASGLLTTPEGEQPPDEDLGWREEIDYAMRALSTKAAARTENEESNPAEPQAP
jgi:WD40 repeat protein